VNYWQMECNTWNEDLAHKSSCISIVLYKVEEPKANQISNITGTNLAKVAFSIFLTLEVRNK
jgi:hypothetical protein